MSWSFDSPLMLLLKCVNSFYQVLWIKALANFAYLNSIFISENFREQFVKYDQNIKVAPKI